MDAILDHSANASVIRSLSRRKGAFLSVVGPDAFDDPYYPYLGCGSHPDIVSRVWDELGRGLPPSCRRILCGTPVLIEPETGLVLAICYGTRYALRVPDGAMPAALQAGCKVAHRWGDDHVTDLATEFGDNWVFGCFARAEEQWCREVASDPRWCA